MADTVTRLIERTIPELEDLKIRGLFSANEIRSIVKTRTDFEYRINARAPDKVDYLRYIKYEHTLDALRVKRKARIASQISSISDHAGEKRLHFIFSRALKKFQGDLTLWNQYIDFAMSGASTSRLSKIFPEALRLHPTASQLWIKAAVWEYRHNSNIATARMHMQRAIRLNGNNDQSLWIEYFRLELDYVRKVRARRKILGLPMMEETNSTTESGTPALAPAAVILTGGNDDDSDDSDGNSDGNSDSDDESSTNSSSRRMTMGPSPPPPSSSQPPDVTGVTGDVTADFFKGTIPFIVYSNACRTVQDNTIAFNVQFLGACEDDFPWLSKTILNQCRETFEESETFWDMYARLPQTTNDSTTAGAVGASVGGAASYSDGFELPEDKPAVDEKYINETVEERHHRVSELVNTRYQEAVERVPTSLMWTKYLEWKMSNMEQAQKQHQVTGTKRNIGNNTVEANILELFATAHSQECLEPSMYRHWVRNVVIYNDIVNSSKAAVAATTVSKKSTKRRRTTRATFNSTATAASSSSSSSSSSSLSKVVGQYDTSLSSSLSSFSRLTPFIVAQRATQAHPTSTVTWKIHISVVQQQLADSEDPQESVAALNALYAAATESIDSTEQDAWEIEAMWMQLQCHTTKEKKWKSLMKKGLQRMRRRKYTADAIVSLLQRCYAWINVEICRKITKYIIESGEIFSQRLPIELFRMSIAKEMRATNGNGKACATEVRYVYEQYVRAYATRIQAWLEFVRYELAFGDVNTVSRLNWRAKKAIGDDALDTWESEFLQLKLKSD